jgi:hypothetical protein
MSKPVVTSIELKIPAGREHELLDGYAEMNRGPTPDGLIRSELLRSFDGAWRIETTWRDRDALMARRASGEPPAALALLDRLGAEHSHSVFTVEQTFRP